MFGIGTHRWLPTLILSTTSYERIQLSLSFRMTPFIQLSVCSAR